MARNATTTIKSLTALNVRALRETMPGVETTATTATFPGTPQEAREAVMAVIASIPAKGHPRQSLHAVVRKLETERKARAAAPAGDVATAAGRRANSEARQAAKAAPVKADAPDLLKALLAECKAQGLKAVKAAPSPNGKHIRLLAGKDTLAWLGAQTRNGLVVKPRLVKADLQGTGLRGFKPHTHSGPAFQLITQVQDAEGVKTAAAALVLAQAKLEDGRKARS